VFYYLGKRVRDCDRIEFGARTVVFILFHDFYRCLNGVCCAHSITPLFCFVNPYPLHYSVTPSPSLCHRTWVPISQTIKFPSLIETFYYIIWYHYLPITVDHNNMTIHFFDLPDDISDFSIQSTCPVEIL